MAKSKKSTPSLGDKFKQSVEQVAEQLGKPAAEVSKTEYFSAEKIDLVSEWDIRKLGGYNRLMTMYYPPEVNSASVVASRLVRNHRNKLDARYGRELFFKEEFLSVLKESLAANPIHIHKMVKPVKKSGTKMTRSLVVHFSDTHYGCNIETNEVNKLNEFNWTIAARRSAFLIDQAVTYKPHYRENTELVILINGDIIAGVIHDQEWAVDLLTTQFAGAIDILSQAISYGAQHFSTVRVICTPGNHGRAMHKTAKDRATTHKWDSYENMVYIALREIFKPNSRVKFEIPECPYAIAEIQGHKFMITHGDTVINVGNPGKNLNMKSINEQINRANSQLIPGNENFAAIVVGHVHVSTVQETDSGTMLLINGTLSGLDAYAHSLGIYSRNATQTIFEVVPGHAVGDIRMIRLKDADKMDKLDEIIKPFKGKF